MLDQESAEQRVDWMIQQLQRFRSAESKRGLSIAPEIVQAHGGDISVASRLGEGSTFTVTLPRGASA